MNKLGKNPVLMNSLPILCYLPCVAISLCKPKKEPNIHSGSLGVSVNSDTWYSGYGGEQTRRALLENSS